MPSRWPGKELNQLPRPGGLWKAKAVSKKPQGRIRRVELGLQDPTLVLETMTEMWLVLAHKSIGKVQYPKLRDKSASVGMEIRG